MTRALRTAPVKHPKTQGERIRFARQSCGLSQSAFGKAIGAISKMQISKSLVSKWELDGVANPNNANLLAMQAVTGYAFDWFVQGGPPRRVEIPSANGSSPLNPELLSRALRAAEPELEIDYEAAGRVMAPLYDVLLDTPEIEAGMLARFAKSLRRAN